MVGQRRFVDLHTHSYFSDGMLAPAALIDAADRAQLAAVALTDHDTVDGLPEASERAKQYPDLQFVVGMEISVVYPAGTMHILALGFDPQADPIRKLGDRLREARRQRNPKMIAKLQALGLPVTMDDVLERVYGPRDEEHRIVGRLHIAETLRSKGLVRSIGEAFERYIGPNAPAYVDKERVQPSEAVGIIRDSGGSAVLAHPPQLNYRNDAQLRRIIKQLVAFGMDGLECYHSDHSDRQTRTYLEIASEFGLFPTGGSDFHGDAKPDVALGHPRTPISVLREEWVS